MLDENKKVTKELLQQTYGELYMMEYYIGPIKLKKLYINPIRLTDRTPSGAFYQKGDSVDYIDFAQSDYSFDVFKYVMFTFNLTFPEAIERIANDLNYKPDITPKRPINIQNMFASQEEENKRIEFIINVRSWSLFDLKYWGRYNITEQILNLFNVKPVMKYDSKYLETGKILKSYKDMHHDPCYAYYFTYLNEVYNKMYRPITTFKNSKWKNNCHKNVVQGLEQLKYKSNIVFITSSLKDVMTLYSLGYEAVAPLSETSRFNTDVITDLAFAYDYIVVFFDEDKAGKEATKALKIELKKIVNSISTIRSISTGNKDLKDISDYLEHEGVEKTKELIVDKLKKIKIKKK